MNAAVRARLLISGRVQGVFYRASTREQALRLGLGGWVCNLPTGQVEAIAEGARPAVEQLIEWSRQGPRHARVDGVSVEWQEPVGESGQFEVRY